MEELCTAAWRLQGAVTIQEVDSVDGRFILNFSVDGDKQFVLRAQPWHYKQDGIIFASFDGKGNPADVDLGIMPIWAQVRDLPFKLKTEAMGWTLGEQLGEVITVSHRNKMIVDKYLCVRVEIMLHEPLRSAVAFTPLGNSKELEFEVRYEKLPLYYECCGLVGHNSERFCRIPKENRKCIYFYDLHVDAYWKEQGSTQRSLVFGGPPKAMEGAVGEVASAVRDLVVSEKGATAPGRAACITPAAHAAVAVTGGEPTATQIAPSPGQEGQAVGLGDLAPKGLRPGPGQDLVAASAALQAALLSQAGRVIAPLRKEGMSLGLGQEGHGLLLPLATSAVPGEPPTGGPGGSIFTNTAAPGPMLLPVSPRQVFFPSQEGVRGLLGAAVASASLAVAGSHLDMVTGR